MKIHLLTCLVLSGLLLRGAGKLEPIPSVHLPDFLHYSEVNTWFPTKINEVPKNTSAKVRSEFWLSQGKWKSEWYNTVEGKPEDINLIETFDGKTHNWLSRNNDILYIEEGAKDVWLSRVAFVTAPFLFALGPEALLEIRGNKALVRLPGVLDLEKLVAESQKSSSIRQFDTKIIDGDSLKMRAQKRIA